MRSNRARPVALRRTPSPESWYRIENKADGNAAVFLYDEVGMFGVTAADFTKDLRNIKSDRIELRISSPGGEVWDGLAIYQALRNHPAEVDVFVDSIAASSASFIAQAGDTVTMARNAQMMIHEAHAVSVGNSKDMRDCAELLDKCSDNIADIYAQRAGGTVAQWRQAMGRETWYSADEAVKAGLADGVTGKSTARNEWDLSVFMFAGRAAAPDPFAIGEQEPTTEPEPAAPAVVVNRPVNHAPPTEPDPEPDPEPESPPDEAGFFVPDIRDAIRGEFEVHFDINLMRAAIELGINDVPAPDPRPIPEQPAPEEPAFVFNLPDVRRALKGALL